MPKKTYRINSGSPEKIIIQWKGYYKNIHVYFNGELIATFESKKALKEFVDISTSTSSIKIRIRTVPEILVNNIPIHEGVNKVRRIVRNSYISLYLYGILNIFIGATLVAIARLEDVVNLGNISIILGVVFIVLGVITQRGGRVGVFIAILLLLVHIVSLYIFPSNGETRLGGGGYGGMLLSAIILYFQVRAISYLNEYRYIVSNK